MGSRSDREGKLIRANFMFRVVFSKSQLPTLKVEANNERLRES